MLVLALATLLLAAPPSRADDLRLPVPAVRQGPERCGPAALEMVLRYYGADSTAARVSGQAYDPALRGSLITDLAAAARHAGLEARVETLEEPDLRALLAQGVPPILLYQSGDGPVTRPHYGVLVGWDSARRAWLLNDGSPRARSIGRAALARRWKTAGRQALVVRRRAS